MSDGHTRIFLIGSVCVTLLLFVGLRPLFVSRFVGGAEGSLVYGLTVCFLGVVGSYFLLQRALAGTNHMFMAAFVGGILGRLFLFAAAIAIAFAVPALDGRSAAIAILAAFFPLTALEVYSVVRAGGVKILRDPPGGRRDGTNGEKGHV